jgi:hypothetical protein
MEVRFLTEKDYDKLCEWWKWWRWTAPTRSSLPNNGIDGIMVSKNGVDICAGFIYRTNSTVCLIEWIVSNPEYKAEGRQFAIEHCINVLCEIGKQEGFSLAFTTLKHQKLINTYSVCGFIKGSEGCTEMIKKLI